MTDFRNILIFSEKQEKKKHGLIKVKRRVLERINQSLIEYCASHLLSHTSEDWAKENHRKFKDGTDYIMNSTLACIAGLESVSKENKQKQEHTITGKKKEPSKQRVDHLWNTLW